MLNAPLLSRKAGPEEEDDEGLYRGAKQVLEVVLLLPASDIPTVGPEVSGQAATAGLHNE